MLARLKKRKSEEAAPASVADGGELNLRAMLGVSDEELKELLESGAITADMLATLPQNHAMKVRLNTLQKDIRKELSGQLGIKEFRGNILGALRWSALFEWGVSRLDALKEAKALSDRVKDAQILIGVKTAGEQVLKLIQGGQPQVGAPGKGPAQGQGVGIAGGGAGKPDLATLIAKAKEQLAANAAKNPTALTAGKAAPNLASVPVNPTDKSAADKLKEQREKEALTEQQQNKG